MNPRSRPLSSIHASAARLAVVGAAMLLGVAMLAAPASAVAPANDVPAGATVVSLGDHVTQDTTEATTDAGDTALNASCGAPATKASVWFSYTAATDGGVILDMSASSYSGGFLVFAGAPSADTLVACGPTSVFVDTSAGTTYTIMAIDDDSDGDIANGGTLQLHVADAGPAPTLDLAVDRTAKVTRDGTALVTGSYTCTDGSSIEVFGDLRQRVGRFIISGFGDFFDEGTCDGVSRRFTMPISGDNGRFAGGKSASFVYSYACGSFTCAEGYVEQTIRLTRGR